MLCCCLQYEKPWDPKAPVLKTCNPNRMVAVSHTQPPQPVETGAEVIFTYDVKFTVSSTQLPICCEVHKRSLILPPPSLCSAQVKFSEVTVKYSSSQAITCIA
jgi:hypothetical protein